MIKIPNLSLVVLIGPSGAGKSTFARRHFRPTEVLSSDAFRGLVSDDDNNQAATKDAFDALQYVAAKRLARGNLTVIDATNVQKDARQPLVALARKYHCLPVAIVLNVREEVCHQRNLKREDRSFGPHVVRQQRSQLRRSLKNLKREGFRNIFVLDSVEQIDEAAIERVPLWNDRRTECGPFDIIGDVHGCCEELEELLDALGYVRFAAPPAGPGWLDYSYRHPEGRRAIFVGDLVDRGPRVLDTIRIVRSMVDAGTALCVPGNHDVKFLRKLNGRNVRLTHGLQQSWDEVEALDDHLRESFSAQLATFLDGLVSHYVLDAGRLVVAHAGLKEELQGRGSGKVREFCLYGDPTGETDAHGLPVRRNWAADYRGAAAVVYGHTPVAEPEWLNNTTCVDTGCVFGGKLTALQYPEREFVSVPARQVWCESKHPLIGQPAGAGTNAQQIHDDLLDADDVVGKRIIFTELQRNVTVRAENATAALEVMSRFAVDPRWLIYLPPTMSPCETSSQPGVLEHPAEAFAYFRSQGVARVVCEEKHMGSRAVVVVCKDAQSATARFGVEAQACGIIYSRTGRRFFSDVQLEAELLQRLNAALTAAGFWEQFDTAWACFDCELMPWSVKAQELLRSQYAAVGAAGRAALESVVTALSTAAARLDGEQAERSNDLLQQASRQQTAVDQFAAAYQHYCWPVRLVSDLKLAPFHLLATEGRVHVNQSHVWHMQTLAQICNEDPEVLLATPYREVNLADVDHVANAIRWWTERTERGGEGMVVKPEDWIVRGRKGLVQPAVKCRGREYLRIIYSPDYDSPANLPRLRHRRLGHKRSLALREFALGIESLKRFVRREPLRKVHECVFGVLALESEPVDPRL